MEDFLARHSEFYRTLSEFPEGTTLNEVLEQAGCTTNQLAVLMELEDQKEDIYKYAFGVGLLYNSLKDQDISELLRVAEFLCLSAEIIRKLRIQQGAPETLKMLVPKDISIDFGDPNFWISIDNVEGFKKTFKDKEKLFYCETAAIYGSLKCLQWARGNGCLWGHKTCAWAAENGHLEILQWAHENGCPWYHSTCNGAAKRGHLECLQWAHNNGCPWIAWTTAFAAGSGNLDCLKWARENGCPWNRWTCQLAARYGQLECLKWAHENGCPWDEKTCQSAVEGGRLECLKWAHEHGCPWDAQTIQFAKDFKHLECLNYALEHGCPTE